MFATLLMLGPLSQAATLQVGSSSTYTTIQSAIDAAVDGDVIVVEAGTWSGGLVLGGKSLTLRSEEGEESTFLSASGEDIAVDIQDGGTVTLDGFTIRGAERGVVAYAAELTLRNLVVTETGGSSGLSQGAALSIRGGSDASLYNCRVHGNSAPSDGKGAGLFVQYSDVTIAESSFYENSADRGGGMYFITADVTLSGSSLYDNSATQGGGIYLYSGSSLTVENTSLESNEAESGGGLYGEDSELSWEGGAIAGNVASGDGGGLHLTGVELSLGTRLSENQAAGRGGGFYGQELTDVVILGDLEDNVSGADGGGGWFSGDRLSIEGSRVADNQAQRGGGLFLASGSLSVREGRWVGNSSSQDGGGLYAQGSASLSSVEFQSHTAGGSGGSIFTELALSLSQVELTNSEATADGGGIYSAASLTAQDSLLESCRAGGEGGGVYSSGEVTLRDSSFESNSAVSGSGLRVMGDSAVTLVGFRGSDHAGEALSIEGGELYAEGLHLQGNGMGLIATGLSGGDITGGDVLGSYGDGLSLEGEKLTLSNLRLIDNLGTGLALQGSIQASNIDSLGNQTGASLEGGASLVNAILAWNAGAGVSGAVESVRYSNSWSNGQSEGAAWTKGEGNIEQDPLYQAWVNDGDPSNDSLLLEQGSPCRDSGDPSILDSDKSPSDMGSYGGPGAENFDADGDGWGTLYGDCDDENPEVYPGAEDLWYDGVDSDCAGNNDYDQDGDEYSSEEDPDVSPEDADCDDEDPEINPGAADTTKDQIDQNCDGVDGLDVERDRDGDGFTNTGGDCNDEAFDINPLTPEVCGDLFDNDCDGLVDLDDDDCERPVTCGCQSPASSWGWSALSLWLLALLRRRSSPAA